MKTEQKLNTVQKVPPNLLLANITYTHTDRYTITTGERFVEAKVSGINGDKPQFVFRFPALLLYARVCVCVSVVFHFLFFTAHSRRDDRRTGMGHRRGFSHFRHAYRAPHRRGAVCPAPLWFCPPARGYPAWLVRASCPSSRTLAGGIW